LILGGVELGRRGEFAVARLKPDGNRDSAFGIGGWAESAFEGGVFGIGVQPDGKILVAGHHHEPRSADPRTYLAVARLTPQGRLDTSFARSGRALINLGGSPEVSSGFLEPSGKLLIVFSDLDRRERDQVTLARVNANGRIDRTFGHGGIVRTPVGGEGPGLAVQSNGKVIVSGARGNSLLVARYSRNGRIDTSFGRAGLARRAFPRESLMEGGLGIDSEGRILVAGLRTITVYRGSTSMLRSRLVLVRFSRNGRLDRSFGRRGKAGGFGKNYDQPNAIVLQRDDKTLVAGTRYFSQVDKTAFFVARYLPS
jgi:uncharacterized delta-60 repeat protein